MLRKSNNGGLLACDIMPVHSGIAVGAAIMKRVLLTSVSALALVSAQSGFAADLGARMPVKAPPPVRVFSWTGCYIGGHVGWGWGRTRFADTPNGDLVAFFTGSQSLSVDTDGFIGGGQIGCDYQFAPNWVIGLEGQFSGADINGSTDVSAFGFNTTFHSKTDWLASVTGRLGYAWDPHWLLYVKGGAAWAHDKYDIGTYLGTWSTSTTRDGWTVGGGLEWAFADNWSAKLEYQYYDFGDKDLTFINPGFTSQVETIKDQIHTVKIGLNYHFNLH